MENVKLEQLQNFFKTVGLEDEDFKAIAETDIEDLNPFVEKIKGGIKEHLMADKSFLDEIQKPFKDAPIGKENQLKKEIRKAYNLQMTEDELKKTPFHEILKKGIESQNTSVNGDVEKYKQTATEWMEKYEQLESKIPGIQEEIESKYRSKFQEKEIREELVGRTAIDVPQVQKENLPFFVTAFQGYAEKNGWSVAMAENKALKLVGSDGLPIKNEAGHILKVSDALKEFASKMNMNVAPKGTPVGASSNGKASLLDLMGRGLS